MKVAETELPGVLLIEPDVYADDRGHFLETFRDVRYEAAGMPALFRQDNLSFSTARVLRGLHLQHPSGQAKLVFAVEGEIFDVAVDVRVGSPGFGRWTGARLSADNRHQLFVPEGYAHGFCVLSNQARVVYKCTTLYDPKTEMSIAWNDPDIAIDWPVESPRLSAKDAAAPRLRDIDPGRLPRFEAAP
jgi:dTDP-4-dehydrorhamnose 3,5-epimerase